MPKTDGKQEPATTQASPGPGGSHRKPQAAGRGRWNSTDLALIAVFAALVAGSAVVPGIPVGNIGVPITLQTLFVLLTGLVLGAGRAAAAVGLYVLLGLAGLPIFSNFRGGLGILAGPSAGYIIAFPLAAALAGWLAAVVLRRTRRARGVLLFVCAMAASLLLIHTLGVGGMVLNAKLDVATAIVKDAVFLPGDVIKNVLAALIAVSLHKAFPDLLVRRAR